MPLTIHPSDSEADGAEEHMDNVLICTRFVGTVEFLRRKGITGEVTGDISSLSQVRGRDVFGNCPLWLAAEAKSYTMIVLPQTISKATRSRALSADQLEQLGARLARFSIRRISLPEEGRDLEFQYDEEI